MAFRKVCDVMEKSGNIWAPQVGIWKMFMTNSAWIGRTQKARYISELAQTMIQSTYKTQQPLFTAVLSNLHP